MNGQRKRKHLEATQRSAIGERHPLAVSAQGTAALEEPVAAQQAARLEERREAGEAGASRSALPLAWRRPADTDEVIVALRRGWRLIAVVAAAAMLLALLVAALQTKRYRATAVAAVAPVMQGLTPTDTLRGVEGLDGRVVVSTMAALVSAPSVKAAALAHTEDAYDLTAAVEPNTNLFNISVEGADPKQAAAIANRLPALLAQQAASIYGVYRVTLVSPAIPPETATRPRVARAGAAGLLLGAVLGSVAAWMLDAARGRRPAGA